MVKRILDRENYVHCADVEKLEATNGIKSKIVELFGKSIELYDDPWMWHLHLKITDYCNAKCAFCVEKNCAKNDQPEHFIENVDKMLTEMEKTGILYSVSVTGGEPTIYPKFVELCEVLKRHNIQFLTMNTNGHWLNKYVDVIDGLFDWINISRHRFTDEENNKVFGTKVLTVEELRELRAKLKQTKMRIQCVMEVVDTPELLEKFIKVYDFADDTSFRRLMKLGDEYGVDYNLNEDNYVKCLEYCYKNYKFVEQTIQDYYIYEIYEHNGKNVTFSYSNMAMLRTLEKVEDDSKIREFIIHPNGVVSGSWKMDNKIILR